MRHGLLSRLRRFADRISPSEDMVGDGTGQGPVTRPVPDEWRSGTPPPESPFEPSTHEVRIAERPSPPSIKRFPHPVVTEEDD